MRIKYWVNTDHSQKQQNHTKGNSNALNLKCDSYYRLLSIILRNVEVSSITKYKNF